jgi:hypothetical protein
MKNVNWDKCPTQGLTGNLKDYLPLNFDLKVVAGMKVSSEYQGKQVHLNILEETSDNKYTAIITGFQTQTEKYKDLSIDNKVCINREYICYLMV